MLQHWRSKGQQRHAPNTYVQIHFKFLQALVGFLTLDKNCPGKCGLYQYICAIFLHLKLYIMLFSWLYVQNVTSQISCYFSWLLCIKSSHISYFKLFFVTFTYKIDISYFMLLFIMFKSFVYKIITYFIFHLKLFIEIKQFDNFTLLYCKILRSF